MKRLTISLCLIGIGTALISCQRDWSRFKTEAAKKEIPRVYVSDLETVASRREVLKNINPENHLISLNGFRYEKGLCANSPTEASSKRP